MTTPTAVTPIQSATEAIQQVIGGYHPENLMSAGQVFPDMKEFYEGLATSLNSLADTLGDESPLHEQLVESLREQASALAGLRDQAEEGEKQFQTLHEDDISRVENPRTGETMADYAAHQ